MTIDSEGMCPMCGGDVYLGHCKECGEPVDPIKQCQLCGDYHEDESECEAVLSRMD